MAVALTRNILAGDKADEDMVQEVLELLAESQSMLRSAVLGITDRDDPDQCKVFRWLEHITHARACFIQRHMRADDPADPARHADLQRRIEALHARWSQRDQKRRAWHAKIQRIHYHFKQLDDNPLNPDHDWAVIARTIHELAEAGTPPSNVQLRELLLPRLDDLPHRGDLPPGAQKVLTEIDRYLASRPAADSDPADARAAPAPEVRKVRQLLAGRTVMMIGGECRPESQRKLEQAFGLRELIWKDSSPHPRSSPSTTSDRSLRADWRAPSGPHP